MGFDFGLGAAKRLVQTVRTQVESRVNPTRQPANPATGANHNQDTFQPARTGGPNLTGEGPRPVTFEDGNAQVQGRQTNPDESSTTTTASTGNGEASVTREQEAADGSTTTRGVTADGDSVELSAGREDANGNSVNGAVDVSADGVTASGNVGADLKGLKIEFGVEVSATRNEETKDGFTTVTAEGSMSVNLNGEVDAGVVGFGAGRTEGVRTEYQLRVPEEAYRDLQARGVTPDPYNPDTMPVGSSVMTTSSSFEGTEFEASYRAIKLQTNVEETESASTLVEKTGENTVRVTIGPEQAIENSFELGVSIGPVSAQVGNTTSLENSTLKTAEFDLSTDAGRAAYNRFLASGEMPSDNGEGISGVATVRTLDYQSVTSAGGSIGPLSGQIDLADSSTQIVQTEYPDGSIDQVTDAKLHAGTPVQLTQHFRPDGTEDYSRQEISMHMVGMSGDAEELWSQAYGVDESQFDGKMDVKLTLDAEQAMELSERAQRYVDNYPEMTGGAEWNPEFMTQDYQLIDALAKADNPTEVAQALINAYGGPAWMGNAFMQLAISDDGVVPPPGDIKAVHRDQN